MVLPEPVPGTKLRILATTDLGAAFVPVPTSVGPAGTCDGVAALLAAERARLPTVWLDAGDLAVGPVQALLGRRPWAELGALPLSAAAAGNHEFDDGVEALRSAAGLLGFPLLCADVDVGLPGAALIHTDAGPLGVVGLTHPATHRFAPAPPPVTDRAARVRDHAARLRAEGAERVVVLLHDGADWWPSGTASTSARTTRLARTTAPWASDVDLILGGHTPGGWTGTLSGTPAGHAPIFASTVLVVDVPDVPRKVVLRGVHPVPAVRPDRNPAVETLDAADDDVVGESRHTWLSRTGAPHYLPDLIAAGFRAATGADAGLVLASQHTTQGAVDGTVAALPAGPVTTLDLYRLFGTPDDRLAVLRLRRGELPRLRRALADIADPRSVHADDVWWNWCRMPNAIDADSDDARTVAVLPNVVDRIGDVLGRDVESELADVGARRSLLDVLR
ncbi:metallophosphoesterase [Cryptosporangium aurantiacum]|uniref:2',3'-cyclic-nucleotide 2'-phosphodiesterase/5'-or 3'-nucleotidase, 5'-nucleotidase family n=1 Tax=Cryptosporangium aurantiacum TaxID=134849 RepID=A0A1M7RL20_9ACTN|nr:metallophosphoesterase [Cryptosporangium aurantiacum]SHN46964.1 2',3'-cyclic-nucleotide 2'-phosphodiesterase/5'-or 3'-nucleotidase, 5'-nucleotidase family [Cryptosporangium aurantiacum]